MIGARAGQSRESMCLPEQPRQVEEDAPTRVATSAG